MTSGGPWSFSVTVPSLSLETMQLLAGARPCVDCATPIAAGNIVDDLDAEHPVSLGWQWSEYATIAELGTEHTAARCRALRTDHGP